MDIIHEKLVSWLETTKNGRADPGSVTFGVPGPGRPVSNPGIRTRTTAVRLHCPQFSAHRSVKVVFRVVDYSYSHRLVDFCRDW